MPLVSTDEINDTLKKYEKLWSKVRDLIRSMSSNSDHYNERYIEIKFNSDDDLLLEFHNIIIVARYVFLQKAINVFNDVTIPSVKDNDYVIHFWYMSKDEAISLLRKR